MGLFDRLIAKSVLALALALPTFALAQTVETDPAPITIETDLLETEVVILNDPLSAVVTSVCPFKDSVDYEPGRVKCGFITVPENREVPDSRMIRIAFAQIVANGRVDDADKKRADDEEEIVVREDPVVYLTGGPGVGITPYVERFLDHEMTDARDIYILNQRGISASEELCPFYSQTRRELVLSTTTEQGEREAARRMVDCFSAATARGIDLRGYNTVENARDVRALRLALGLDSWNVWGISYGSHLGQMLVNIDPDGIRALVLDAIVPNDLGELMRLHRWIDRDFQLIFDECERQGARICDDLEARMSAVFNSLMEKPLTIPTLDEELHPSGSMTLPAAIVAFAPFQMMYEQDEHPAIPAVMQALIDLLETQDPDVMKGLSGAGQDGLPDYSEAMGAAIRCNDGYTQAQADIAADDMAENPRFAGGVFTVAGSVIAADACVEAGLPPRDRADYQLIQSDIPTLIVNGDWDPITPPALAERIAPGFTKGRLIIVPYAGHGPTRSMSECGTQVMTDFFDDPTQDLTTLDASCLETGVEPPEFISYLQTGATLKFAGMALEDEKSLIAPALYGGALIATLLIGLIAILFGAVARRFVNVGANLPNPGPARPRILAFATTFICLLGVTLIGVGAGAAMEMSEISLLAGFAPPARFGSMLTLLGGVLGLVTIILALTSRTSRPLRWRTLIGLPLIGLAAVLLAVFLIQWDLAPW
ncbi:MAG: alpha/beta fold hydrolase [Litorimonas sp.]